MITATVYGVEYRTDSTHRGIFLGEREIRSADKTPVFASPGNFREFVRKHVARNPKPRPYVKKPKRIPFTDKSKAFLEWIQANPGKTTADLHRAIGRLYAHGRHKFTYDTVGRLIARGAVECRYGSQIGKDARCGYLYPVEG